MSSQQKAKETVAKYLELLSEKKSYEFSQKMLALGHRKNTSGKPEEAVYLYLESSKELVQANELNSALSLIQNVFDILKANTNLADETLKSEFLSIFSLLPQGEDKLKFVNRLLNEFYIGDAEIFRLVSIDLLNHQQYHLAQKYVINLSDADFSINFLKKWMASASVTEIESEFFVARYVLAKIAGDKLDEAEQITAALKKDTPLFNYIQYLLRACRLKSRKAYGKLSQKYNDIISIDQDIMKILKRIASQFFGYESEEQGIGLGGLFSSLLS